jgi:hypothetical protein
MYSNYGQLSKGDLIPRWWIEQVTGIQFDDKRYSLASVGVAKEIEAAIRRSQGVEVFTKSIGGDIQILTDEEAVTEAPRRHEQAVAKIRRTLRKANDIDTVELDPETKKDFDRNKRNMTYQEDALSRARRETGAIVKSRVVEKPAWR